MFGSFLPSLGDVRLIAVEERHERKLEQVTL